MGDPVVFGRRLLSAALACAVALAVFLPAAQTQARTDLRVAGTARYSPPEGGVFNVPSGTRAEQSRIEATILAAIRHARAGSMIRISLYSFDRGVMADALVAAKKRGAHVQILLNDHQFTHAMRVLRRALGTDRSRKNFFHICKEGCRSRGEYLHSKFFIFSRTGAAENVVMAGSYNFTNNANVNQWNDLYIHNNGAKLYKTFSTLFDQMAVDKPARRPHEVFTVGKKWQLEVFPFARATAKTDPMMLALRPVRCFNAAKGSGIDGRTVVRVAMHSWRGSRGVYLAKRIRSLFATGCNVKVMYGMSSKSVRDVFAQRTKRGYLPVRANGFDTDEDGKIDKYAHEKALSISGHYGTQNAENRIYTGSSNWSGRGLTGDEIVLRVRGRYIFRQWYRNFNQIWTEAGRDVKYQHARALDVGSSVQLRPDPETWEND